MENSFIGSDSVFNIPRVTTTIPINAVWDKQCWRNVKAGNVAHFAWIEPKYRPVTQMKMAYDDHFFYVVFRVRDKFVRALTTETNGAVWEDAAVELFFAPDTTNEMQYFNLEINCIGTPLMFYVREPMSDFTKLPESDIRKIEIASTFNAPILEEITGPVTWVVEYKVPLSMLETYANISRPAPGVIWRGNFFKIATNNSNKHYVSWSPVVSEKPQFHQPRFFGKLRFTE